jgi:FkbM family methyltransferase
MSHRIPGLGFLKATAVRTFRNFQRSPDSFLKQVKGVIHVGANLGQERDVYAAKNLNVLWVEPIPDVYQRLTALLTGYPKQRASCNLVADVDGREFELHISSNGGCSSSILDLAEHRNLYPDVTYVANIKVTSVTLPTLVEREHLDISVYDALVMDTQGSELLILKGAVPLLPHFRFIMTEVADFESYKGCCLLPEMDAFMKNHGFRRVATQRFFKKRGVGSYYNVAYASGG